MGRATVDAGYWLGLAIWTGALMTAAMAASSAFAILPELPLSLDGYAVVEPEEPGRIAAGKLMEQIFFLVDVIQAAAIVLVLTMGALQMRRPDRARPANLVRIAVVVIGVGLYAYRAGVLMPALNHELRAYWAAAAQGDVARAQEHRERFATDHPTATRLFGGTLLAVIAAIAVSPAALAERGARGVPAPPELSTSP